MPSSAQTGDTVTPATSSGSTASGIISYAVTHTIQPAAALMSHGSACAYPLGQHKGQHRAQGLHQSGGRPGGKGLPPGAPALGQRQTDRRPLRDILQADTQAQCQRAAYGICVPCSASAAASPTTMPSGRSWWATALSPYARNARAARQQLPGGILRSRKPPQRLKMSQRRGTHAALPPTAMAGSSGGSTRCRQRDTAAIPRTKCAGLLALSACAANTGCPARGTRRREQLTQSVKTIRSKPHSLASRRVATNGQKSAGSEIVLSAVAAVCIAVCVIGCKAIGAVRAEIALECGHATGA